MELRDIACKFNISTDTRTIKKGDFYLPLKGANFDGEDYIQTALDKGAAGFFTTKDVPGGVKVKDTLQTYLELARLRKEKIAPITVAITGSSGKTTTKEMIASVLEQKFKVHKTLLNHNNEVGFCQTVFSMPEDTQVLVLEMGMRGLGEIELLSRYAQPDIAVITNLGSAHIGRLGSLDNIAKAKCEITKHLKGRLIALESERLRQHCDFAGEKIFYPPTGDFNTENAAAAREVGLKLGLSEQQIKAGIAAYKPIEKRWESVQAGGFNIINDAYNANPESMVAAVNTFVGLYPNSVVVLGDMNELGEHEIELHKQVGQQIKGDAAFLTVGELAKHIGVGKHFDTNSEISRYILANFAEGTTIFLKASRAMKLEEIIEGLKT